MSEDSSSDSDSVDKHSQEWPASFDSLRSAKGFLQDCARSSKEQQTKTLLLPDKDADGLSASQIIYHALVALGHPPSLISVHFVTKGSNIHTANERTKINEHNAQFVIAVDQGSRGGPPLADGQNIRTMVIDHHWSEQFPKDALVLSAAKYPPVATSSALAYMLCKDLPGVGILKAKREYLLERLCIIGTIGDLGSTSQFEDLWPREDMKACVKKFKKKTLHDVVSLINAPRRTSKYDVDSAWNALMNSTPEEIVKASQTSSSEVKRLHEARAEIKVEIAKVSRSPPLFSGDGHVALVRVTSGAQVHPVIATRWANSLKSSKLRFVMCANDGYLPGMSNFSCRVAKCASQKPQATAPKSPRKTKLDIKDTADDTFNEDNQDDEVNIIESLIKYAARDPGLREAMGEDFARGHKQASGGIVQTEYFERLWKVMLESEPPPDADGSPARKRRKADETTPQKNTLDSWIKRA
ncbi:hypothetical protein QCA50_006709 [Cerrena zonata]|uniref:DDH domain-containing protein n=1 Tax=Cerrena zonata TaxID=2478898 RepID=A0AAW0GFS7_9APHY